MALNGVLERLDSPDEPSVGELGGPESGTSHQVRLVALGPALAGKYAATLRRNAEHLQLDPVEANLTDEEVTAQLEDADDPNVKFAVMLGDAVIGRVDLNPVAPPRYAVGYWIDAHFTRRGHGAAAVALAVEHARDALGATDVYAGVTHGNHASVRLLQRVGFVLVADMGEYERFHLPLDGGEPRNPSVD